MKVQELGAKLRAINDIAVPAVAKINQEKWDEAEKAVKSLQQELDEQKSGLKVDWSRKEGQYIVTNRTEEL